MSRPNLIRADTLDLQDHDAPSAQDHQNQPTHPAPLGTGPPAPHQDFSLRQAQEDRAAEQDYLADQWGSGRSSHEGSDLLDEDTEFLADGHGVNNDDPALNHNGAIGRSSDDSEMVDVDDDTGVDDDIVDKISSSPSIDDEDIDFEFVYALHTFVATVEGQANATKGDTMQLLDDSNSYWWLVRVCKDSSIGYLPAEHIETPTERLARLNKHRNADLSREHLGDSEVKPKSMFKQALKRQRAKMVQFTTPTYYEASEVEWSDGDDQDPMDGELEVNENRNGQMGQEVGQNVTNEQISINSTPSTENDAADAVKNAAPSPTAAVAEMNQLTDPERQSDDSLERSDSGSKRSRNGNIRNTDSFFKDETAEPKKMSLTPSLLRDVEQSGASNRSGESREKVVSPISETFENIDKTSPTTDKFKDDRKKKKEKSGMLSGLFKRKEKKIKVDEAAGGTVRTSQSDLEGMLASPTPSSPIESTTTSPREQTPPNSRRPPAAGGKLVKSPPPSIAAQVSAAAAANNQALNLTNVQGGVMKSTQPMQQSGIDAAGPAVTQREGIKPGAQTGRQPLRIQTPGSVTPTQGSVSAITSASPSQRDESRLSTFSNFSRSPAEPKKEKLKPAKQRMELDVDSSPEQEVAPATSIRNAAHTPPPPRIAPPPPRQEPFKTRSISPVDAPTQVDRYPSITDPIKSTLSESPVSPSTPTESTSTVNTPETASEEPKSSTAATSTTPDSKSHARSGSEEVEWDDSALHRYLENQSSADVRDLLLLIHDKNEVKPVSKDHPIMREFNFEQHQKKLDDMSSQLDGMLNEFLARKSAKRKVRTKA